MKIGDTVRLKNSKKAGTAVVRVLLTNIEGGVKLDRPLDGFKYWNVEELVKVRVNQKEI